MMEGFLELVKAVLATLRESCEGVTIGSVLTTILVGLISKIPLGVLHPVIDRKLVLPIQRFFKGKWRGFRQIKNFAENEISQSITSNLP
jgi:hypothetical protein